jgi:thioredoxin 1
MSDAVEISASDFHEKVLESDEPVVVEFFSHSCPHCKKFNPIYKELTQILNGEARFFRIDVLNEQNRILAHSRGVRTVPTMEVFYRGRVIGNITGYHHLEKVYEAIKGFIMKKEENVGPGTPLNKLLAMRTHESLPEVTAKGFQIRWFKKAKVSNRERQLVKKDLESMSGIIGKVLNCTKEEALENPEPEIRLPLRSQKHRDVYLTIEYCNNGWHLILESPTEIIGEIVSRGFPFIQTLKENEIETDII